MQDSQGDHQLIFVSDAGSPAAPYNATDLTVLNLSEKVGSALTSAGVDDVRWADGDGGTLYVVDDTAAPAATARSTRSAGPFFPGEVFASVSETGPPNSSSVVADGQTVDTLNLATGTLTPFATGFAKVGRRGLGSRRRRAERRSAGGGRPPGAAGAAGTARAARALGTPRDRHLHLVRLAHELRRGRVRRLRRERRARDALARRPRYASGATISRDGRVALQLRAARALARGRYTLTLTRTDGATTHQRSRSASGRRRAPSAWRRPARRYPPGASVIV